MTYNLETENKSGISFMLLIAFSARITDGQIASELNLTLINSIQKDACQLKIFEKKTLVPAVNFGYKFSHNSVTSCNEFWKIAIGNVVKRL